MVPAGHEQYVIGYEFTVHFLENSKYLSIYNIQRPFELKEWGIKLLDAALLYVVVLTTVWNLDNVVVSLDLSVVIITYLNCNN